jgi:hypothetical protein
VWTQGSRGTIVGNTVLNSTREHCVRAVTADELTVEDNNLANPDRSAAGDAGDGEKGCIEIHMGAYAWISNNTVADGDIRVGPRGAANEPTDSSTDWCVVQDNQLTDTMIFVQPGAHDAMIRNNVIIEDATSSTTAAIQVNGPDADGRIVQNLTLVNNTVIDNAATGNFLQLNGAVDGITMVDNLFVAPHLIVGDYNSCAVYVAPTDLSSFTRIADNVWPTATGTGAGAMMIGGGTASQQWETLAQWTANPVVSGDAEQSLTTDELYDGSYQLLAGQSASGQTVGSSLLQAA